MHATRAAGQHHNVRPSAVNADMQRDVIGRLHYELIHPVMLPIQCYAN